MAKRYMYIYDVFIETIILVIRTLESRCAVN